MMHRQGRTDRTQPAQSGDQTKNQKYRNPDGYEPILIQTTICNIVRCALYQKSLYLAFRISTRSGIATQKMSIAPDKINPVLVPKNF